MKSYKNKEITSSYKQSTLSSRQSQYSSSSHYISVEGTLLFPIISWSKVSRIYESEIQSLYGLKWAIVVKLNEENQIGIFLMNKMNENIIASYKIRLKNQLNSSDDMEWSDPDGEICFYSCGSGDHYWGNEEFISIDELECLSNGYYLNDKILIEVSIKALVLDELGALTPTTNDKDDTNSSSSSSSLSFPNETPLETATKELNNLSLQMSQKVRLLSEDAILQDKLILARLQSQHSDHNGGIHSVTTHTTATIHHIPSSQSLHHIPSSHSLSSKSHHSLHSHK